MGKFIDCWWNHHILTHKYRIIKWSYYFNRVFYKVIFPSSVTGYSSWPAKRGICMILFGKFITNTLGLHIIYNEMNFLSIFLYLSNISNICFFLPFNFFHPRSLVTEIKLFVSSHLYDLRKKIFQAVRNFT